MFSIRSLVDCGFSVKGVSRSKLIINIWSPWNRRISYSACGKVAAYHPHAFDKVQGWNLNTRPKLS